MKFENRAGLYFARWKGGGEVWALFLFCPRIRGPPPLEKKQVKISFTFIEDGPLPVLKGGGGDLQFLFGKNYSPAGCFAIIYFLMNRAPFPAAGWIRPWCRLAFKIHSASNANHITFSFPYVDLQTWRKTKRLRSPLSRQKNCCNSR